MKTKAIALVILLAVGCRDKGDQSIRLVIEANEEQKSYDKLPIETKLQLENNPALRQLHDRVEAAEREYEFFLRIKPYVSLPLEPGSDMSKRYDRHTKNVFDLEMEVIKFGASDDYKTIEVVSKNARKILASFTDRLEVCVP